MINEWIFTCKSKMTSAIDLWDKPLIVKGASIDTERFSIKFQKKIIL